MNLYPAAAFARHLLTSRSAAGHGVHSPYAFDFLTSVVRGKTDERVACAVEDLRREMLRDKSIINVTDLGTGREGGSRRKICEIAATTALPRKYALLLARMVQAGRYGAWNMGHGGGSREQAAWGMEHGTRSMGKGDGVILELGTSLGISALAMALAAPERRLVTVEGCPALAAKAAENLRRHDASNAEVLNMEFSAAIDKLQKEHTNISFAFIDGNHYGAALKEYVSAIRKMGEEMIIVADDINLSHDMYRGWRSIAASGYAGTTMEMFRFAVIFRLDNITPGHYLIRY